MRTKQRVLMLGGLLTGIGMSAQAAEITWGASSNVTAAADVSTNGYYLVEAFNAGVDGITNVTVNGVTFVGTGELLDSSNGFDAFTNDTPDAAYNALLSSCDYYSSGVGHISVGNGNLVSNGLYEIQVWYADNRKPERVTSYTDEVGTTSAALAAVPGQFAIGTFTADGTSQDLYITTVEGTTAKGPHINAYQLRCLSALTSVVVEPQNLDQYLYAPETTLTGLVDVAYAGMVNVEINVSVSNVSHSGAFELLSAASQTLTDPSPSNTTLEIEFDNAAAGLVNGETATGQVSIAWNEVGGTQTNISVVPFTVLYVADPESKIFYCTVNDLNHWGSQAVWTNTSFTVGQLPSAGNSYVFEGSRLRTDSSLAVFPGESLELRGAESARLSLKNAHVTVSNLIMNAGTRIANDAGGLNVYGAITTAANVNSALSYIQIDSGADGRDLNINAKMTIGSNIDTINVDMGVTDEAGAVLTINNSANSFTGTWDVITGTLIGSADGSLGAASFNVQENGMVEFDYAYSNDTQVLTVESGGLLMLNQDVVIGAAALWGETLAEGAYSVADLQANAVYGASVHSNSLDSAYLYVGSYVAPIRGIGSVAISVSGSDLMINVTNTVDSASYTVQMKNDLVSDTSWSNLVVVPGSNGVLNITLPNDDTKAFYRVIGE